MFREWTSTTKKARSQTSRKPIRVNRQWRLVFQWDGSRGEASEIYLDDHSYR